MVPSHKRCVKPKKRLWDCRIHFTINLSYSYSRMHIQMHSHHYGTFTFSQILPVHKYRGIWGMLFLHVMVMWHSPFTDIKMKYVKDPMCWCWNMAQEPDHALILPFIPLVIIEDTKPLSISFQHFQSWSTKTLFISLGIVRYHVGTCIWIGMVLPQHNHMVTYSPTCTVHLSTASRVEYLSSLSSLFPQKLFVSMTHNFESVLVSAR